MTTLLAVLNILSFAPVAQNETFGDAVESVRRVLRISERLDAGLTNYSKVFDDEYIRFPWSDADSKKRGVNLSSRVHVILDSRNGVRSISVAPTVEEQRAIDTRRGDGISRAQAEDALRQYWEALYPGVKLKIALGRRLGIGWQFQVEPIVGSLSFLSSHQSLFSLDSDRGQIRSIHLKPLPGLRLAGASVVNVQSAEAGALRAYSTYRPYAQGRIVFTQLALGVPGFPEPHEMSAEHRELVAAYEAIPPSIPSWLGTQTRRRSPVTATPVGN